MKIHVLLLPLGVYACDSAPKTSGNSQGIARMTIGSSISVVFTSEDNRDHIDEVLSTRPKSFHWSAIEVPASNHDALYGDGLTLRLDDPTTNARFSQVYRETCNPATENLSPCWIYETYTSGEAGLSGTVTLQLKPAQVMGGYEVSWEGDTDRFGAPVQHYAHQTVGSISATLLDGETQ